jgi:hypothetical protein
MKVWQVYVNGNMVGVINDADNDGHARFLAVQRYNISPDDHCSIDPIWYNSVTGEAVSNNAGSIGIVVLALFTIAVATILGLFVL